MHWTISKITQPFAYSVLIAVGSLFTASYSAANPADVRVLVDVSGSMKKADPKAVRGPATALLAALLPDQSRSGIWLFGSDVRELVPYGPVNARWDALARPIEESIGSTDRFTHMESALRTGINASGEQVAGACHVILITDGIVDVQGGKDASTASRDRILKTVLPDAIDKQCRIHTIALSPAADIPLLRQMAIQTNGLFTLLDQPGDLIPVMLDALELALRSQQLPIRNQQIQVDSEIRQLRLIRLGDQTPIELKSETLTVDSKVENSDISYYSGNGYQTMIWSNPSPGRYTLTQPFGLMDRILLDSDVRLNFAELPPTISTDQTLGLNASIVGPQGPLPSTQREFRVAFGSDVDPIRFNGDQLAMQIDSPSIGRSILTVQSFDETYERQIQRAFEVLTTQPALEIGSNVAQGVGVVGSSITTQQDQSPERVEDKTSIVPDVVSEQLPEELRDWPLWQLVVSALGAIALIALIIGLVLRPTHHEPK